MRRALGWLPVAVVGILLVEVGAALTREYAIDAQFLIAETVHPATSDGPASTGESPDGSAAADDPFSLWVLGDSTAAGLGAAEEASSLPVLIARRVADATGRTVVVRGLGVSGARTHGLTAHQIPQLPEDGVDAVVITVGSNDVTHLTAPWTVAGQTRRMVLAAVEHTNAPVVLGGIPRFYGVGALLEPLRSVTDGYAALLRRGQREAVEHLTAGGGLAGGGAVTYVDIASEASPRFRGVPEAMSPDGFHPSGVGYGFWADALAPPVVKVARAAT